MLGRTSRGSYAEIISGAEPIDIRGSGQAAVLLLHGFGDTPQTLHYLAGHLQDAGYGVHVPLLPGHGRTLDDFTRATAEEWIDCARQALLTMRARYPSVAVGGLSMGGALAAAIAAEYPDIPAMVLLAPYLGMPLRFRVPAAVPWLWGWAVGAVAAHDPRSVRDPLERAKNLGYGQLTAPAFHQLWRAVRKGRRALPRVLSPTLIIQSRDDNRIAPQVAEDALARLGARDKRLIFTERAGHILTVDYGRDRVFHEVGAWLAEHMPGSVAGES